MHAPCLNAEIVHRMDTVHGPVRLEMSLQMKKGEILAVTGPSGAGKTTLLRILAGLIKPDFGILAVGEQVWCDSRSRVFCKPQDRSIGMVFQDYALFPHWTIRQNLLFALEKGQDTTWVDELLAETELLSLADRRPGQLSGGQQQRAALARAMVRQPRLMLLDEPLSALDSEMRSRLQDFILRMHQRFDFSLVVVSHDLPEIFRLADRVMVVDKGKLLKTGSPAEIYSDLAEENESGTDLLAVVLEYRVRQSQIEVLALINDRTQKLLLPLSWEEKLEIGGCLLLRYQVGQVRALTNPIQPNSSKV